MPVYIDSSNVLNIFGSRKAIVNEVHISDEVRAPNTDEQRARLTLRFHKISRFALTTFCIAFALASLLGFLIANFSKTVEFVVLPLIGLDVLVLLGSGITYAWAIYARDAVQAGRRPWSFSLRGLLIATTLVAILLTLIMWAWR